MADITARQITPAPSWEDDLADRWHDAAQRLRHAFAIFRRNAKENVRRFRARFTKPRPLAMRPMQIPAARGIDGQLDALRAVLAAGQASMQRLDTCEANARKHLDAAHYHLQRTKAVLSKVETAPVKSVTGPAHRPIFPMRHDLQPIAA